jgi:prepilin-type N-terminal cleavage/methylation domain-containing protein
MRLGSRRRDRAQSAGFTLVELMTVVAIMGILATLAIMGVRQHMKDSRSIEATAQIQAIRAAQEARRAEVGVYLNCSTTGGVNWYPAAPDDRLRSWVFTSHPDYPRWRVLGVSKPEGVRFGYLVNAGAPGTAMTTLQTASQPGWPTPVDPWYVIQAAGDSDSDDVNMLVAASSVNAELYIENDHE